MEILLINTNQFCYIYSSSNNDDDDDDNIGILQSVC